MTQTPESQPIQRVAPIERVAPIQRVTIVGAGVIGASWAALFVAHGLDVVVQDPAPDAQTALHALVASAREDLAELGCRGEGRLSFESDLARAVATADFVQENAPEREEVKRPLLRAIQEAAPDHAIIASSTTALLRSRIVADCPRPERVLAAHPFNPPHLIPLVEITGAAPDDQAVRTASAFYRTLGREPVVLKREAVGHLANRLAAAVWREALYIVEQGIAEPEAVDRAMTAGPGLRWAAVGPFTTYHLGGGAGGIAHYMKHLGPSQQQRWADLGTPKLDEALTARVVTGVEAIAKGRSLAELAKLRDRRLKAILKAR